MPAFPAPPQGDENHPPLQWVCDEYPGMGWELNDILTTSFYRFQIPNLTTNQIIVAPSSHMSSSVIALKYREPLVKVIPSSLTP
jgi:hypothetical protein